METIFYSSWPTALGSLFFYGLAVYFYRKRRYPLALAAVLAAGLLLRAFVDADDFLHEWDERFHALVAKNLVAHPWRPTLVERPALDFGPASWCCNHIWLNKPPLPLWLMAGSLWLFGLSEWAVRLPSLLLSLGAIGLTFAMGNALFDRQTGLIAAFLHSINGKLIELAGGRISSDHVETCHIIVFQCAMWFVIRDWQGRLRHAPLWIGLFTGLTFLSKWLPAGLIPAIWALGALSLGRPVFEVLKKGLLAGVVALAITLPWLAHIWLNFPAESRSIFQILFRSSTEITENHAGPWYFYLDAMRVMFGEAIYLPLAGGIWYLVRHFPKLPLNAVALASWIALPLLLFSASTTKRDTYLLIAAPAFFLLTAAAVQVCRQKFQRSASGGRLVYALAATALLLLPLRYGIERTRLFIPRERRPEWRDRLEKYAEQIAQTAQPERTVIFLMDHPEDMMFYHNITAYGTLPDAAVRDSLRRNGWQVWVMRKDGLQAE